MGRILGLDLLHLEPIGPGDQGPPDQEVEEHDDADQSEEPPQDVRHVPGVGRGLEVRAEAGEAEVATSQHEHLAGTSRPAAKTAKEQLHVK